MKNKILIIDQDPKSVDEAKKTLKAGGFDVISASNGQSGFHKIKTLAPDMVLLHAMKNSKTKGSDTARAIAADAAFAEIPVVLIVEKGESPEKLPAALPVKEVLVKPVSPERLIATVNKHVQKTGKNRREVLSELDSVTAKWKDKKGNLIMILHEIQNHYGYIPRGISFELSRLLKTPLARIYEVLTFYNYFKIEPPGKHLVSVCMGTACYLKGGRELLAELKEILNIEQGQTTEDGIFQLQVVRCLGCCGLAPVVMIDENIHGNIKPGEIAGILAGYSKINTPSGKGA